MLLTVCLFFVIFLYRYIITTTRSRYFRIPQSANPQIKITLTFEHTNFTEFNQAHIPAHLFDRLDDVDDDDISNSDDDN